MHDGGQRDAVEGGGELVAVGHVAGDDVGTGSRLGERGAQFAGAGRIGSPPGQQQQVAHAVPFDEVAGEQRAEAAGAAGDQHGARPGPGGGHGQDDLADVLGLLEQPQRLGRPGDVARGHRDGTQHALLEQVQRARASISPMRSGPASSEVEGAVRHSMRGGDLVGVADVGLAHLDEPSAGPQQPQRGIHELPGERVQHHIDTRRRNRASNPAVRGTRRGGRRARRAPARPTTCPRSPSRTPRPRDAGRAVRRPCRRHRRRRGPAPTRPPGARRGRPGA